VRNFHWSSCIATPLFDFEQNLLGCLDFTVAYNDGEKLKHLIPVLLNTANCIQFELSLKNKLEQFDLFHSYYRSTFDYSKSMLLLVNGNGVVIDINRAAQKNLRLNPVRVRNAHIGTVFDDCGKLFSILKSSGRRHFVHSRQGGRFAIESTPISDPGDSDVTFLLRIDREKHIQRIADGSDHLARYAFSSIIGEHPVLVQVVEKAKKVALPGSPILIEGETGTGKELFAHAIHTASSHQHGPFVAVNCSAFPRELIESELFGYEKGAYTGARTNGSPGKFELANHGTLFLDEIHTMDKATQMKILRVVEDRRVTRIGGKCPIPLEIRIVAASSESMAAEMAAGNFLPPLYYRLNVVKLAIPSLRQRKTDIPILIAYFIDQMNAKFNQSIKDVSAEAMNAMSAYGWPGNVRELKNCLESAFNFCTGDTIIGRDLFDGLPNHDPCKPTPGETLDDLTRRSMIDALQQFGNVKQAARSLDIPLATFYRKLKKYGISWGKGRGLNV
jgi:transcriptional regulator with PAS, ATPase and Fis domain